MNIFTFLMPGVGSSSRKVLIAGSVSSFFLKNWIQLQSATWWCTFWRGRLFKETHGFTRASKMRAWTKHSSECCDFVTSSNSKAWLSTKWRGSSYASIWSVRGNDVFIIIDEIQNYSTCAALYVFWRRWKVLWRWMRLGWSLISVLFGRSVVKLMDEPSCRWSVACGISQNR